MLALHKKQIKLRSDNFCRGEEQTSVCNLIFWTEVEQFSVQAMVGLLDVLPMFAKQNW